MARPLEVVLADWRNVKKRYDELSAELDEAWREFKTQSPATSREPRGSDLDRLHGLNVKDAAREYLRQTAAAGRPEITYGELFDTLQKVPSIKQTSAGGKKPWHEGENGGWRSLCIMLSSNSDLFRTRKASRNATRTDTVELIQPKTTRQ